MSSVAIIGSGNVGASTAFFLAEQGSARVRLFDLQEGLAAGKALDLMEAAPIRGYRARACGVARLEELADSEIFVLAAGAVRHPGMRREELVEANAPVIAGLARQIRDLTPQARVIVATEPVDAMTAYFVTESGLPRFQVMGLGGFLDSTRLRHLVARELGLSTENVSALVIGPHGRALVAPPAFCRVSGVAVTNLMSRQRFEALVDEVRGAGDAIVELARRSSAYYAPGAAAAELVEAIRSDLKRVLSVSVRLEGELGLDGVAISLPAVVGAAGVERLLVPQLEGAEQQQLREAVASTGQRAGI